MRPRLAGATYHGHFSKDGVRNHYPIDFSYRSGTPTAHLHFEQRTWNLAKPIWFDGKHLDPGYSFTYNGPSYKSTSR